MGRISARLARLEDVQGSRSSCPGCGYPSNVAYDAIYIDSVEAYEAAYEDGPEFCEVCGRKVLFPVFFTDDRTNTLPVMICRVRAKEEYANGA